MTRFAYRDRFRSSGRTTRLADQYVQKLFDNLGEWVHISDHYPGRRAAEMLAAKIFRRMEMEHNIILDVNHRGCNLRIPSDQAYKLIKLRDHDLQNW